MKHSAPNARLHFQKLAHEPPNRHVALDAAMLGHECLDRHIAQLSPYQANALWQIMPVLTALAGEADRRIAISDANKMTRYALKVAGMVGRKK